MSLGLFPSPPTDNLYKFVAVAGLLLFIGAPVYWATFYLQLAEKENAAQVAKTELANQILKYGTLPAPPKRGEQPSPGFTEALAKQQELIETRRREARLAEAQEALFQRLSRVVGGLSIAAAVLGAGLGILGFSWWYARVQRPQDQLLLRQAGEAKNGEQPGRWLTE